MNNYDYIKGLTKKVIEEQLLIMERGGGITTAAKEGRLVAKEIEPIFNALKFDTKIRNLMSKLKVNSVDDFLTVIKNDFSYLKKGLGVISKTEASQLRGAFELNILKNANSPKKLLDISAENLVKDARFRDKYKAIGNDTDLVNKLMKEGGYSKQGAEALVRKKNELFPKGGGGKTGGGGGNTKPTPPPVKPRWWDPFVLKIKNGIRWKDLLKWGAAIGIPAAILWSYASSTGETDKIEDFPPVPPTDNWPPCIMEIISDGEAKVKKSSSGAEVISYTSDEYPGGLEFYTTGRVFDVANKRKGTYSCKSGQPVIEPTNESKNLSLSKIYIQEVATSNEIDLSTMSSFVDDAVDDLDGYVAVYNLNSLKNILSQLSGKTYKGQNAITAFLEFYKEDEGGDDFISDVESVGVKTLGVEGMELKKEILQLAKGGAATTTTTTGDKIGLKNIDIKWDSSVTPVPKPKENIYHDCSDKTDNFEYGCISPMIAQIQACKGITPTKGYFGPKTKRVLGVSVITKALYDEIMRDCNNEGPVRRTDGKVDLDLPTGGRFDADAIMNAPSKINMKPPKIEAPSISGEQLFTALKSEFNGELGDDRLAYRGPDLSDEQRTKLNQYLGSLGYRSTRMRDPEREDKMIVIWKK